MAATAAAKRRARDVAAALAVEYPEVDCALTYDSPLQLLVAVILSAQCTDERVNKVTPGLFRKYPTAADFAAAPLSDIEEAVRSTGFYRNKAKNIQACCRKLVERHGGEVPQTLEELTSLDGVGRKTANVVLGTAFGIPSGVVVDTHVTRLSNRLGLTTKSDAVQIERDLIAQLPPEQWIDFSHRLIWHGRRVCKARKPLCAECSLAELCPKRGVAPAKKTAARKKPNKPSSIADRKLAATKSVAAPSRRKVRSSTARSRS